MFCLFLLFSSLSVGTALFLLKVGLLRKIVVSISSSQLVGLHLFVSLHNGIVSVVCGCP